MRDGRLETGEGRTKKRKGKEEREKKERVEEH